LDAYDARQRRLTSESLGSATIAVACARHGTTARGLATAPVQKSDDKRAEPLHLKSTIDSTNCSPKSFYCRSIEDATGRSFLCMAI
jgi:hypothetical protein